MKKKKPGFKKDNFIDFLSSMTPEEINNYIKEKGKKAKPVSPLIINPNPKLINSQE